MPFDVRDFPGAPPEDRAAGQRARRLVACWLFGVAFMVLVMIVLGGVTRLTGSGLSIMEWDPIMGALPPISQAEWQRLYHLYQQIPQYALVNEGFGLDGFKQIFWLEWSHRLWGRLIGFAFLVPLIWFWATGRIERRLRPFLVLLFTIGALQGAVGWFMVASGFFPETTAVSPARLEIHLGLALVLYVALIWTSLSVLRSEPDRIAPDRITHGRMLHRLAWLCCGLIGITMLAGGFVAGTRAGFEYNTFPLMDGQLVPPTYAQLQPFLRNLTENLAAVQFDHRLLATLTALAVAGTFAVGLFARLPPMPRFALLALGAAAAAQYLLGVATLLSVVQVDLAALHQAMAVLLLTSAIVLLHATRSSPPAPRR
jgi:cytochrome c oxidase assembly protein subunit 15